MPTIRDMAIAKGAIEVPEPDVIAPVKNPAENKIDNAIVEFEINQLKTIKMFEDALRKQTDSERQELLDGIRTAGRVHTPIKVWVRTIDGNDYDFVIVDGHNRYEIAKELGQ